MSPDTKAKLEKELRDLQKLVKDRTDAAQNKLKEVQDAKAHIHDLCAIERQARKEMTKLRGHRVVSLEQYRTSYHTAGDAMEMRRNKLRELNLSAAGGKVAATEAKRVQARVDVIARQLDPGPGKVLDFERR